MMYRSSYLTPVGQKHNVLFFAVSYTPTTRWKLVYEILQLYNVSCLTMTSLFSEPRVSKGHKGVKNLVSKPASYYSISGYLISWLLK